MNRYPNISDHGLIGDLQTAALVTTDGVLDWFCCPRFDSPSVFASLLDAERGGFYQIAPDRDDYVTRQLYLPDTAILVTRFMTPDGVGEVHDFMPVTGSAPTDRHRLVRNIRVVRGVMRFAIEIQPRFDYARKPHKVDVTEHGVVFASDGLELTIHGIAPEGSSLAEAGITLERAGDGLRWTRTLREGEVGGVVLESMRGPPRRVTPEEAQQIRLATKRGRPASIARWTNVRDEVYNQIMDGGWNPKVGAFTQHYDTEVLDSSLLMMPPQGFIAPRDPMWLSTLAAMDRELVSDSLVYRYNPTASPDGLKGDEGTFSLCTFWYVEALARARRLEEARLVFEKMFTYANHPWACSPRRSTAPAASSGTSRRRSATCR